MKLLDNLRPFGRMPVDDGWPGVAGPADFISQYTAEARQPSRAGSLRPSGAGRCITRK